MNICELEYFDEKNRYGSMWVNGVSIHIGLSHYGWKGFEQVYHYTVTLANDWNRSNPIRFHSLHLGALVELINAHPHRLVKFQP